MDQQAEETPTWKEGNTELGERGREQYRLQMYEVVNMQFRVGNHSSVAFLCVLSYGYLKAFVGQGPRA